MILNEMRHSKSSSRDIHPFYFSSISCSYIYCEILLMTIRTERLLNYLAYNIFDMSLQYFSYISWWSVLLMEENVVPGESHQPAQVTDKHDQIMLYRVHLTWVRFELITFVVIGTDCRLPYDHDHDDPSSKMAMTKYLI
jgi:hypothetical protein